MAFITSKTNVLNYSKRSKMLFFEDEQQMLAQVSLVRLVQISRSVLFHSPHKLHFSNSFQMHVNSSLGIRGMICGMLNVHRIWQVIALRMICVLRLIYYSGSE
ncbi:Hypothetical_protein [Hexamita inflata]|uniref:Hypothetical_protein n=1 Tax=Hexamita inflata TaxID=28002 RepID=A0AA86NMV7_9EUKA|nr:Hypothetical protein HINF_LOCUS9982 [Hexamita inflata]